MDPIEIVRRVNSLDTSRSQLKVIWNKVEKYIMPLRVGDMYMDVMNENAINLVRDDIYDSTAIFALSKLANAMHGDITNPWIRWFKREFEDPDLNKDKEALTWLEKCTDIEWAQLYRSNFDSEISSCYPDMAGLGNTFFSTEALGDSKDNWKGFAFSAIPIKESFFEVDDQGDLYRYYRLLNWTATRIESLCTKLKAKVPDTVEKALGEGGDPDRRFHVIYAVYRREGKEKNTDKPYSALERPVGCRYVFKETQEPLGDEDGYYEQPVTHCPWAKTSGSVWGHGIGMVMSPTVEYLNYRLEIQDTAERKFVDAPKLVRNGAIMSDMDFKPGGVTYVRSLDDVKELLPDGRGIDYSKASVQDLRSMIREAFHNDELQLKESPQMSATEAQIRYELMNRVLGPTMGLIQNNLLSKTLDRTFKTLLRVGMFPKPPQQVMNKNRGQVKVVYTGALMRAQQSDEVAAVERWLGQMGAMVKVFPEVKYVINPMKVARNLALKLGITQDNMNSDAEANAAWENAQRVMAEQIKQNLRQQKGEADQAQVDGEMAIPKQQPMQ